MITLNFDEVLKRIYNAKKGVEVRYGLGQGFEYCKQFADEAQGYAINAKASEKKATDAVAGIEQTKTDAVQEVQNAQTTATTAITQTKDAALTDIGNAKTGALQEVASSTEAAQTAATKAEASKQAAEKSKEAAATSASTATTKASEASTSAGEASASRQAAEKAQKAAEDAAALAGTRAGTDKTFSIENAPADAKATGDALAGKADSVVPHDLFIPITGWQTDTEVAEYPYYIDITADVTSTTVVSVSIDPASADVAGKAMLVNPETRTGAIRIRAHNIPTAEISARWYPIKYGGQFYGDGSIYSNFLLAAHPVGSIYQTISPENPSATFGGGTWERIEDCTIWGASNTHPAGTKLEAGLPNITGKYTKRKVVNTANEVYNDTQGPQKAFGITTSDVKLNSIQLVTSSTSNVAGELVTFDASRSSSVYGASTTVQPPAYCMYIWRRVA